MSMIHFVKVSFKIVKVSLSCKSSASCCVENIHTTLSFTRVFLCIYTKVSLCDKKIMYYIDILYIYKGCMFRKNFALFVSVYEDFLSCYILHVSHEKQKT